MAIKVVVQSKFMVTKAKAMVNLKVVVLQIAGQFIITIMIVIMVDVNSHRKKYFICREDK